MSRNKNHYYDEELSSLYIELNNHMKRLGSSITTNNYSYNSRIIEIHCRINAIEELSKINHYNAIDRKAEEIKANIPKRALMIEKASNDILLLPQLPPVLRREIAEYEGGVESLLLGEAENSNENDSGVLCCML